MNEFISQLLFQDIKGGLTEEELCVQKLSEVTMVNIRMSRHDAIVLTKYAKRTLLSTISSVGEQSITKCQ